MLGRGGRLGTARRQGRGLAGERRFGFEQCVEVVEHRVGRVSREARRFG
jgi:hypothetical protein